MINTIVKNHPLRDIVLDFDDAISPPDFEQEALAHYYTAHDLTLGVRQEAADRMARLTSANELLEDLLLRRLTIEQDLDFMEDALGIAPLTEIDFFEGELTIELDEFYSTTLRHNEDLNRLYSMVDELTNLYNDDILKIDEDDFLIDPMYFEVLYPLYSRYEELSVHTVSLDTDHQQFLGVYAEVESEYFAYTDFANLVFEKYAELVTIADKVYRRVEVVQDKFREKMNEKGLGG